MTTMTRNLLSSILISSLLALSAHAQQVVQDRTYESGEQEQRNSMGTISTAGSVAVNAGADVSWEALTKIHLKHGFHAKPGSNFTALVPDSNAFIIVVLDGDDQSASPGAFNARPFEVVVWQNNAPVVNMQVTLTVQSGGGSLLSSPSGAGSNTLTLTSDIDGAVFAWFKHPVTPNTTSLIKAAANGKSLLLHSYNFTTPLATGNGNGNGSNGNGNGNTAPDAPGNPNGNAPDWNKAKEGANAAGFEVYSPSA